MSRKPRSKRSSTFARVLKQLLDDTSFYTRAQWSQFFGISEPALSQWVNDRTVPRADLVRMMIDILDLRGGVAAREALMAFEALMDEPSHKISPIGARFAPDLRSYLRVRTFAEIGRAFAVSEGDEEDSPLARTEGESDDGLEVELLSPIMALPHPYGLGPSWRAPRLIRSGGRHGRERQVSVDDFAEGHRIALVGTAGSGKTAFLHQLLMQHRRWHRAECVSLRNHSADVFDDWLNERLARGTIQPLIFDGIDEMPMESRERAIAAIERFASAAQETAILVASRPVSELDQLASFVTFSIAPLSDVDLVAEVTRSALASKHPVEVDRFLCHLTERENLKPALRNPLFLNIAWSLFENDRVTPFEEGIVVKEYMHVLFARDRNQGFSRIGESWAAQDNIVGLLGEISLHLLRNQKTIFDGPVIERCVERSSSKVPVGKLIDFLLVLGLIIEENHGYCFSHHIFKEFFAASFAIESAVSAIDYFQSPSEPAAMDGAMRMACSLAKDSTPLFATVMRNKRHEDGKFALLAQMLAQPIKVNRKVLTDSCRTLVAWLDDQTADWKVVDDNKIMATGSARWLICAHFGQSKDQNDTAVGQTLRAIHQARSGPACEPLKAELTSARSEFLTVFSEALEVEGRLRVNFADDAPNGAARVAVEHLQLA